MNNFTVTTSWSYLQQNGAFRLSEYERREAATQVTPM